MGDYKVFREKLEANYTWPAIYLFKFIVPKDQALNVKELFLTEEIREKASKNGNYISLTIEKKVYNTDEVISIYEKANKIKGIIAL